ncbi:RNA 2'-phosphotransferase [Flavobacterium sp. ANB]|uniref:RNA 2'-phosphotransferase n=1 Tax=unclassified Flavobacterium TaxID=196869 RepID=UPI0012B7352D|nr:MULTISPECIES: RNA 2'-phosphotransferase [unclassified Flavobacterium]MBF4517242.1 RNA 2'-phosphotransferase [Flavobacterium sp. ANB]MTD70619.1 RNA 2'-phosphotransferase [Flavobacterium sp. LC2016-13]
MNEKAAKSVSKFLSLVLRHSPETIELKLDENGWADVDELILKCNNRGSQNQMTAELLDYVVENNDKKRFTFNEDRTKIRASQGHSISVELDLKEAEPSEFLYHGTVEKFLESIKKEGLQKMSRQHVHLSKDKETAIKVGGRRGVPQILTIKSREMFKDGFKFYLSENNVWLTDEVPAKYIEFK